MSLRRRVHLNTALRWLRIDFHCYVRTQQGVKSRPWNLLVVARIPSVYLLQVCAGPLHVCFLHRVCSDCIIVGSSATAVTSLILKTTDPEENIISGKGIKSGVRK